MESLDREVQFLYHLTIAARVGQLTNLASLSISIIDENDNAPRFLQSDYDASIPASATVGTCFISVFAHDEDSGENGVVSYAITGGEQRNSPCTIFLDSGNDHGYFSINEATGEICTATTLVGEHAENILTVRASDGGKIPLSDSVTVRILTIVNERQTPKFAR
jgi:hypothetical protein